MMLCMLISSKAIARFGFGVEAAMTTSSLKITILKDHFTDAVNGNSVKGFEAGIFLRAGL